MAEIIIIGPGWLPFLIYYIYWLRKRKLLARLKQYNFQGMRYFFVIDRWSLVIQEHSSVNHIGDVRNEI